MQILKCDGCPATESLDTPQKMRTIRTVKFQVINDSRENIPEGTDRHEADLCARCIGTILSKYFRFMTEEELEAGHLELPTFLEKPTESDVVRDLISAS